MKIKQLTPIWLLLAVGLMVCAVFGFGISAQALSAESKSEAWFCPTEK